MYYIKRSGIKEDSWNEHYFTEYGIEIEIAPLNPAYTLVDISSFLYKDGELIRTITLWNIHVPEIMYLVLYELIQHTDKVEMDLCNLTFTLRELP